MSLCDLVGAYRLDGATNDWHEGEISYAGLDSQGRQVLTWKNRAGASWPLYPDLKRGLLITGKENPYWKEPIDSAHQFEIRLRRDASGHHTGRWLQFYGGLFPKSSLGWASKDYQEHLLVFVVGKRFICLR